MSFQILCVWLLLLSADENVIACSHIRFSHNQQSTDIYANIIMHKLI